MTGGPRHFHEQDPRPPSCPFASQADFIANSLSLSLSQTRPTDRLHLFGELQPRVFAQISYFSKRKTWRMIVSLLWIFHKVSEVNEIFRTFLIYRRWRRSVRSRPRRRDQPFFLSPNLSPCKVNRILCFRPAFVCSSIFFGLLFPVSVRLFINDKWSCLTNDGDWMALYVPLYSRVSTVFFSFSLSLSLPLSLSFSFILFFVDIFLGSASFPRLSVIWPSIGLTRSVLNFGRSLAATRCDAPLLMECIVRRGKPLTVSRFIKSRRWIIYIYVSRDRSEKSEAAWTTAPPLPFCALVSTNSSARRLFPRSFPVYRRTNETNAFRRRQTTSCR